MLKVVNNIWLLVILLSSLIGVLTHSQSFNLSLYGDDWLAIYLYFVPDGEPARFGPLPSLLTYLTPFGPSIFLMGKLYEIFGTNYHYYYVISLILRLLGSWTLFLLLQKIIKNKIISFLTSVLFSVGFIGIQTTDWVFYMNVYLGTSFFFLCLYFQFKYFDTYKNRDLLSHLGFFVATISIASVRLFPIVFIIPLIDVVLFFGQKDSKLSVVVGKTTPFLILVLFLWFIGVFGGSGKVYSPDAWSAKEFFEFIITNPGYSLNSFLHWVGIVTLPDHPSVKIVKPEFTGLLFMIFYFFSLVLSRKDRTIFKMIMISGLMFFIFLTLMWFYSRLRLTDSTDRYLLLPFAGFCILIGVLSARFCNYFKIGVIFLLMMLILVNFLATRSIYQFWLAKGRSVEFGKAVDKQITKDFSIPVTSPKIIFLASNDTRGLHSLQFGLLFKMLVLTKTWDYKYFNSVHNEKEKLIKEVSVKIDKGESKQDIINSIYAYGYRDNKFFDITQMIREELLKKI